jgi:predicted ATPase
VWLIDLAPPADLRLVPSALASVLGLGIRSDYPLPGLVAFLGDRQVLLVRWCSQLRNYAHVIEPGPALAVGVLKGAEACISGNRLRSPPPRRAASRPFSCSSSGLPRIWAP